MDQETNHIRLLTTDKIRINTSELPQSPDAKYAFELADCYARQADFWNKELVDLRKRYSTKVFIFLCAWSGVVISIVLLAGFSAWGFHISDTVLSILLGTTTVNAIGVVWSVIRGLFNADRKQ